MTAVFASLTLDASLDQRRSIVTTATFDSISIASRTEARFYSAHSVIADLESRRSGSFTVMSNWADNRHAAVGTIVIGRTGQRIGGFCNAVVAL